MTRRLSILALVLGALALAVVLAALGPGEVVRGSFGFAAILILGILGLASATRWAGASRTLAWLVVLTFAARLIVGVAIHLALPSGGYGDADDRAGYMYTDAHRRDSQAWELAASDHSLLDAFRQRLYTDQYGGLLAFSALVYRFLSPDAHRPLILVLVTALFAAAGLPFLWKGAVGPWGERVRLAACVMYALYPESVLLGGSAMREPYLIALSAMMLYGFLCLVSADPAGKPMQGGAWWLAAAAVAMLLISPAALLAMLVILLGYRYLATARSRLSWPALAAAVLASLLAVLFLASSVNRTGQLDSHTPIGVLGNFLREAINWDVYQLERGSGWVQKLLRNMPEGLRLPFVTVYGTLQPVLPAALVEPTTPLWRTIAIARAVGWYALLPLLALSLAMMLRWARDPDRRGLAWITFAVWLWIVLAALRGGADQWDNPRYRSIVFVWQAISAASAWVWWRETRSPWGMRIVIMELVLLVIFGQWYASRYLYLGGQLPFGTMVGLILSIWVGIAMLGWLWDSGRLTRARPSL